jgi:hypothetical protein
VHSAVTVSPPQEKGRTPLLFVEVKASGEATDE